VAKDQPTEMHGDYYSSMMFKIAATGTMERIREDMENLPRLRKVDVLVAGSIHALRKLCDGEEPGHLLDFRLYKSEVETWRETFFAWFNPVKGKFSPKTRKQFLANAEDDFRVLMDFASKDGRYPFKPPTERWIRVTFDDQEAKEIACKAAEVKHPVELGHALSQYLDRCILELVEGPIDDTIHVSLANAKALETARKAAREAHPVEYGDPLHEYIKQSVGSMVDGWKASTSERAPQESSLPAAVSPSLLRHDDGSLSLCLSEFTALDDNDDEDWELTAYDVESAVKAYLKERRPSCITKLNFDSESSMFCVTSTSVSALGNVADVIFRFLADEKLRSKYISGARSKQ
jgi:hypothetical protein